MKVKFFLQSPIGKTSSTVSVPPSAKYQGEQKVDLTEAFFDIGFEIEDVGIEESNQKVSTVVARFPLF